MVWNKIRRHFGLFLSVAKNFQLKFNDWNLEKESGAKADPHQKQAEKTFSSEPSQGNSFPKKLNFYARNREGKNMSGNKRFTDKEKWNKSYFFNLSPGMKLVWLYLCDNCDHAGIWDINMKLMSFQIGKEITLEEIQKSLGDKIMVRDGKLLIKSFFHFQWGAAKPTYSARLSAINTLKINNLLQFIENAPDEDCSHLDQTGTSLPPESPQTPIIGIGKGIVKGIGIVKEQKPYAKRNDSYSGIGSKPEPKHIKYPTWEPPPKDDSEFVEIPKSLDDQFFKLTGKKLGETNGG